MEGKESLLEGLSLNSVWTFICIGFALIGIFLVIAKFIDQIKKWVKEYRDNKAIGKQGVTEEIATKVTENITTQIDEKFDKFEKRIDEKFEDIDKKLAADKETLSNHTRQLNAQEDRVDRLDNDNKALLHGMSALLGHIATGNSIEKVKKTNATMNNYLIDRKYNEEDWKL